MRILGWLILGITARLPWAWLMAELLTQAVRQARWQGLVSGLAFARQDLQFWAASAEMLAQAMCRSLFVPALVFAVLADVGLWTILLPPDEVLTRRPERLHGSLKTAVTRVSRFLRLVSVRLAAYACVLSLLLGTATLCALVSAEAPHLPSSTRWLLVYWAFAEPYLLYVLSVVVAAVAVVASAAQATWGTAHAALTRSDAGLVTFFAVWVGVTWFARKALPTSIGPSWVLLELLCVGATALFVGFVKDTTGPRLVDARRDLWSSIASKAAAAAGSALGEGG